MSIPSALTSLSLIKEATKLIWPTEADRIHCLVSVYKMPNGVPLHTAILCKIDQSANSSPDDTATNVFPMTKTRTAESREIVLHWLLTDLEEMNKAMLDRAIANYPLMMRADYPKEAEEGASDSGRSEGSEQSGTISVTSVPGSEVSL
jgi:hypothetical protein